MKALILAAGFGTRLLPFTEHTPKPLFTISNRPLLDSIIHSLQAAGCEAIIINTHHLAQKIDDFIARQNYDIPVSTRYEPEILGTGGAIRNLADFWDNQPFMVINSDIVTTIDFRKVCEFHLNHSHPATLVLHDDPDFNSVSVSPDGFVTGFSSKTPKSEYHNLTFTGIQVLEPEILNFIPANGFFSSIEAYEKLMATGKNIKAFISTSYDWKDVGTPERYQSAVIEKMAPDAFAVCLKSENPGNISCVPLKGDGSDRKWYRLIADRLFDSGSLILADHGIRNHEEVCEADSFVYIGRHLHDRGVAVPEIYLHDTFAGMVFMEDLGDVHLQHVVNKSQPAEIISCYKAVIDNLIKLWVFGAENFDLSKTFQTPYYDKELILEKECRYFTDAFLKGYLGRNSLFEELRDEFICLADNALRYSISGFMHRDMQSRNIMLRDNQFYFIDFQGGRQGPMQYDLASLLIDPYVALPFQIQTQLLEYCMEKLADFIPDVPAKFHKGFGYCVITRNLQILGAFGFLSRVRGKLFFEQYIPHAIMTLKHNLSVFPGDGEFPKLSAVVNELEEKTSEVFETSEG